MMKKQSSIRACAPFECLTVVSVLFMWLLLLVVLWGEHNATGFVVPKDPSFGSTRVEDLFHHQHQQHQHPPSSRRRPIDCRHSKIDDDDDAVIGSEPIMYAKKHSHPSRAGGRRRRPRRQSRQAAPQEVSGQYGGLNKSKTARHWMVPGLFLALFLILSNRLGGDGSNDNPSFVYYQSTVFESTILRDDGRRETLRQESFRSNLQELVRQQQQQQRQDDDTRQSEEEAERALNDALDLQRRIWNDFYY